MSKPVEPTAKGRAYVTWRRLANELTLTEAFGDGYDAGAQSERDVQAMRFTVPSEWLGLADVAIQNAPHAYPCHEARPKMSIGNEGCTCWKAKYDADRREMRA